MPAADEPEHRLIDDPRLNPAVAARGLGQSGGRVERGEAARVRLDPRGVVGDGAAEILEEPGLQRANLLLGAEHRGLEVRELGGDVALGVDEGLLAVVVGGHAGGVGLRHLEVVAEHLVVADLERVDSGARALPRLELGDPPRAVSADGAQVVQLGVIPVADHPPLARGGRGRRDQRAGQAIDEVAEFLPPARPLREARFRGAGERLRESGARFERAGQQREVAGRARGHRDAGDRALHVLDRLQALAHGGAGDGVGEERGDVGLAGLDREARAERAEQPLAQQAPAHRRQGLVHRPQQRAPPAAVRALGELERAPGRRVEADEFLDGVSNRRRERGRPTPQGVTHVSDQGARRAALDRGEVAPVLVVGKLLAERASGRLRLKRVRRARLVHGAGRRRRVPAGADQHLARGGAGEVLRDERRGVGAARAGDQTLAGRDVDAGQRGVVPVGDDGRQKGVVVAREQVVVQDRPRREDSHDVPADKDSGARFLHLLRQRDGLAGGEQFGDVPRDGVVGHAAERHRAVLLLVAGGERDVEERRGRHRVLAEELVKIPDAEEEQGAGVGRLEGLILAHEGCRFGHSSKPRLRRSSESSGV